MIRDETGGEGVDVVLDMVGGDYLNRDLRILRYGGRLVMIAFKQGSTVPIDCTLVQDREAIITGSRLRPRPVAEKGRLAAAVQEGGVADDRRRAVQAGRSIRHSRWPTCAPRTSGSKAARISAR